MKALLPLDPYVHEILGAELVYSEEEVYKEFQECCERARSNGGLVSRELKQATKALARMLDRNEK